ncbi:MAG: PilT/PilU family type 4a pilus ATPase [Candidatus Omnitrophica bacterium]|nr:PilT/PilU family type 4a pilus ATPase [Candidatus Omnitrophota bacterium]
MTTTTLDLFGPKGMMGTQNVIKSTGIKYYLDLAIKYKASDIHLVAWHSPVYRVDGKLVPQQMPTLSPEQLERIVFPLLSTKQLTKFQSHSEIDLAFQFDENHSFRANLYRQRGHLSVSIRIIPCVIRSLSELGIPAIVAQLTRRHSGLILIVGRAGHGKTTTMTHMVDQINQERAVRIITIEDPIEFIYKSKLSLIVQREVGTDTASFASGLKHALRQDPDVVVIGEMRDLESISMALTTADTGHLVITTVHAPDAIEAINRIIDVYPGDRQNQIRVQLAENLVAIIGQQLLPRKDGVGRVLATEMCIPNLAIRNLIRRNSLSEIRSQMEAGRDDMYTLEKTLSNLVQQGIISKETAQSHAKYPNFL